MNDAIPKLEKRADDYAAQSLSASTRRAYESDWKHFVTWANDNGFRSLPASPETVCLYMTSLASEKVKKSTISRRKTSIRKIHVAADQPDPTRSHQVSQVYRGIQRCVDGQDVKRAIALRWHHIRAMVDTCDTLMFGTRDRAILLIGWAAALRRSEISALNIGDLEFCAEGLILNIRRSKTDQTGEGKVIGIPRFSDSSYCPVTATDRWIERLESNDKDPDPQGPLFRRLGMAARTTWWHPTERRLSGHAICLVVKKCAARANLALTSVSTHSLRRGIATELAAKGVPERILSRHTRHVSMAVLRRYIEDGTVWTENPLTVFTASDRRLPRSDSSSSSDEDIQIRF